VDLAAHLDLDGDDPWPILRGHEPEGQGFRDPPGFEGIAFLDGNHRFLGVVDLTFWGDPEVLGRGRQRSRGHHRDVHWQHVGFTGQAVLEARQTKPKPCRDNQTKQYFSDDHDEDFSFQMILLYRRQFNKRRLKILERPPFVDKKRVKKDYASHEDLNTPDRQPEENRTEIHQECI
jgi:hypothetical protein